MKKGSFFQEEQNDVLMKALKHVCMQTQTNIQLPKAFKWTH